MNISPIFIELSKRLKDKGVKDHDFFLKVKNEGVTSINPHDVELPHEKIREVIKESSNNPWYFIIYVYGSKVEKFKSIDSENKEYILDILGVEKFKSIDNENILDILESVILKVKAMMEDKNSIIVCNTCSKFGESLLVEYNNAIVIPYMLWVNMFAKNNNSVVSIMDSKKTVNKEYTSIRKNTPWYFLSLFNNTSPRMTNIKGADNFTIIEPLDKNMYIKNLNRPTKNILVDVVVNKNNDSLIKSGNILSYTDLEVKSLRFHKVIYHNDLDLIDSLLFNKSDLVEISIDYLDKDLPDNSLINLIL